MKLYRAKETAEVLGIRRSCLPTLERRGLLKSFRDWSNHRRYRQTDVERFREKLLAGQVEPGK